MRDISEVPSRGFSCSIISIVYGMYAPDMLLCFPPLLFSQPRVGFLHVLDNSAWLDFVKLIFTVRFAQTRALSRWLDQADISKILKARIGAGNSSISIFKKQVIARDAKRRYDLQTTGCTPAMMGLHNHSTFVMTLALAKRYRRGTLVCLLTSHSFTIACRVRVSRTSCSLP